MNKSIRYVAYFLCDTCGHRWKNYYNKVKLLELGEACENCKNRHLPYEDNFRVTVTEPHFYEKVPF